jgi:hypothetical protein
MPSMNGYAADPASWWRPGSSQAMRRRLTPGRNAADCSAAGCMRQQNADHSKTLRRLSGSSGFADGGLASSTLRYR